MLWQRCLTALSSNRGLNFRRNERQAVALSSTLQDVAKKAGVSMKTVSRVVNKEKYVAEETRQQVLRVIDELGYVPHLQAQRLASGRTRSIVLHYPLSNPNLLSNQIEMSFITGTALGVAEEEYYFSLMTGPLTSAGLMTLMSRRAGRRPHPDANCRARLAREVPAGKRLSLCDDWPLRQ